jgi:hypothetical protein
MMRKAQGFLELVAAVFLGCSAVPAHGVYLRSSQALHLSAHNRSVQKQSETDKPQLIFLFLVYDKINNEEIWDRFFASAQQGTDYTALVHCKSESGCKTNIKSQARYQIIPSVETKYCSDLVSGMNALIQSGVNAGGRAPRPDDKFIFVSDSTVPVKPFSTIQSRLFGTGENAHFCIFPRNEWAEIQEPASSALVPSVRAAVKHHQWIILSRNHAAQVLKRAHEYKDLMSQFHMNEFGTFKNSGCLDEFWHFAILFGTIAHARNPQTIGLNGLVGNHLSTTDYEIQGQCDTFVQWVPRANGNENNMTALTTKLQSDGGVDMTPASDKRPATFHRLSRNSVIQFRDSWFLFARKVDDGARFTGCERLVDVFDKLIFSTPPQPFNVPPTWGGSGSWIDTRSYLVSISSNDGAVRLIGNGAGMDAKGVYCGKRVEVVFTSGYRSAATLSDDGRYLSWETGVTWHRQ